MSNYEEGQTLTELSALDELFKAYGTAHVKVTRGTEERILELPIQSVDVEELYALVGQQPVPPREATGGGAGVPKFAPNPDNPAHVQRMNAYWRKYGAALTCMGLAVDIKDKDGVVVWSADNQVRNLEKATAVLKAMGLVENQLLAITRAINELTTIAQEEATQD